MQLISTPRFLRFGQATKLIEKDIKTGSGKAAKDGDKVMPGKLITSQAQMGVAGVCRAPYTTPVTEADREFMKGVIEVNVCFANQYAAMRKEDPSLVSGINADPSCGFNPGRQLPRFAGSTVQDSGFRNRIIGDVRMADELEDADDRMGAQVALRSGGDTVLKGAVVQGGQITADVGGQLSLQSLQDSSRYKESSQTAGFSVTVGPNPSASANVGATKIRSDYQAVAEQTALRAGDGGFQLKVKDGVSLAGAQITSTDKAVQAGVNQLQAGGPVSTSDLLNQAAYDARSVGVSLGQGKDTGKPSTAGMSGAGIGRGQVHGLDVGPGQAGPGHRLHREEVRRRALLQPDAAALQIGQVLQRRPGLDQDGRAVGLGRLGAHVEQIFARGLGEHGGRVTGQAKLQRTDRQGFEQLRACGELDPADLGVGEALLQRALLLDDDQVAVAAQTRARIDDAPVRGIVFPGAE